VQQPFPKNPMVVELVGACGEQDAQPRLGYAVFRLNGPAFYFLSQLQTPSTDNVLYDCYFKRNTEIP